MTAYGVEGVIELRRYGRRLFSKGRHPEDPAFFSRARDLARSFSARLFVRHRRTSNDARTINPAMRKTKVFAVYIMTNRQRSHVLYTGVTGNLGRRVFEHKNEIVPCFTSRYNLHRLVYYENFSSPGPAIEREKEIKSWRRSKKIALIESMNPHWYDLAANCAESDKPQQFGTARKIPLSA